MLTIWNRWVPRDTHPELRSINGALGPTNDTLKAGEEADLDFEIAIPLIWPQRTVLFQTDDEWYQKDQQRADSKYPGFFNSTFIHTPPCTHKTYTHSQTNVC